jgi:hypothetical protein
MRDDFRMARDLPGIAVIVIMYAPYWRHRNSFPVDAARADCHD